MTEALTHMLNEDGGNEAPRKPRYGLRRLAAGALLLTTAVGISGATKAGYDGFKWATSPKWESPVACETFDSGANSTGTEVAKSIIQQIHREIDTDGNPKNDFDPEAINSVYAGQAVSSSVQKAENRPAQPSDEVCAEIVDPRVGEMSLVATSINGVSTKN